jgi:hypothetical protein
LDQVTFPIHPRSLEVPFCSWYSFLVDAAKLRFLRK